MTPSHKISVRLISLGCSKNLVDSELMLGHLLKNQFKIVSSNDQSDVAIVNTCGFIDAAKEESINTILDLAQEKNKGNIQYLIVVGCLSQRYSQDLKTLIPEVDAFLGAGDYKNISEVILNRFKGNLRKDYVHPPNEKISWNLPRIHSTPFYTRYIKISEGCSHQCSFCSIPLIRGNKPRSRSIIDIVNEVNKGILEHVKEFNLIAQDLNEYGRDLKNSSNLYQLLSKFSDLKGDFWIRLLYMYPLHFPDRLIKLIASHPHICPYVDIPLQHINDRILKSMKRGSSSRYIYRLIEQLRKHIPNIIIRTTFLTGYPGESQKEFKQLHQFIKDMEFDRLGVFTYSQEEETRAALLPQQIKPQIKQERKDILMETQRKNSLKKNQELVGQTVRVLFEGKPKEEDHNLTENLDGIGRYYGQAPEVDGQILIRKIKTKSNPKQGTFINVKIIEALDYDLIGEVRK